MTTSDTGAAATVRCPFCTTLNTVDLARAADRPRCGECQKPILLDRPVKVEEADFDRTVLASAAPVLVDFYADWCVSCKELELYTFADAQVVDMLARFVTIKVDVTAHDDASKALYERYGIVGPPALVFYDRAGHLKPDAMLVGVPDPADFVAHLATIE